jgi:hypothetical protein
MIADSSSFLGLQLVGVLQNYFEHRKRDIPPL